MRRTELFPGRTTSHRCSSRSESATPSRTQVRGRGVAPASQGEQKWYLSLCRCLTQARTTRYPKAKSNEETTEKGPLRISPQEPILFRRQTRVDNADHRTTIVPPSSSRLLRRIVRKRSYVSPLLVRGEPGARQPGGNAAGRSFLSAG